MHNAQVQCSLLIILQTVVCWDVSFCLMQASVIIGMKVNVLAGKHSTAQTHSLGGKNKRVLSERNTWAIVPLFDKE